MRGAAIPDVARLPSVNDSTGILRVTFDRKSGVPLYRQLKFHIVHAISTGRLGPGAALPSVRSLCRELGLASATVQRAYAELQADGYVVGEAGRGIYVGDLEAHSVGDADDRRRGLQELLLGPLTQAQALGFASGEIVDMVGSMLASPQVSMHVPRVLFVGRTADSTTKYTQLIRVATASTGSEVFGVVQQALVADEGKIIQELAPIHLVVCLVTSFAEVRTIAHRWGVETYGLMVELSEETKRKLIELPFDARIALVTEQVFLSNTRALVEQIRGHQQELIWAATELGDAELRERLADADVVLHSLGATDDAARDAPEGAERIELKFLPMPASMAHLVDTVAAIARERPVDRAGST